MGYISSTELEGEEIILSLKTGGIEEVLRQLHALMDHLGFELNTRFNYDLIFGFQRISYNKYHVEKLDRTGKLN